MKVYWRDNIKKAVVISGFILGLGNLKHRWKQIEKWKAGVRWFEVVCVQVSFDDSYCTVLKIIGKSIYMIKTFFLYLYLLIQKITICKTSLSFVWMLILKHKLVWITMEMRTILKRAFTTEWSYSLGSND